MLNKYLVMDYINNEVEEVTQITMKDLKKSREPYFKLSPKSNTVYIVNHYDRGSKSYSISPFEDCNKESFIKSSRKIYIGFTY